MSITNKVARLLLLALTVTSCSREGIASFRQLDEDGDGRISAQEAAEDTRLGEVFAQVDSDRDGQLTALEYLEAATR